MGTKIYHNPRCRKSRETLSLVEGKGENPEIILYLETPPTIEELKQMLELLNMKPYDLLRRGEAIFKEKFKGADLSDDDWIQAMIDHPKLMERPIVVKDGKAALGRPPENVLSVL